MKRRGVVGISEAYENSIKLLKKCSTKYGFLASTEKTANYKRIWGRDSMVTSLAALTTGDKKLIEQVKKSLETLAKNQHKHGQIPSNVDVAKNKVSYGGSTGRIDSSLWFIIVFSQYIKRTRDFVFLKKYYKKVRKAFIISHLYEFNDRGLIYVPKGGDWADEYIQEGYVLYDQVLYHQALKEFIYLRKKLKHNTKKFKRELKELGKLIEVNYWIEEKNKKSRFIYQKNLFDKALNKKKYKKNYLLPYFNPSGYGHRFDSMANSLALLFGIIKRKKQKVINEYIQKNFSSKTCYLLPAFWPVINRTDYEWKQLKNNYTNKFKNKPHEYHNGGLWPVITGFYASYLAKKDKMIAEKYLEGINYANHTPREEPNFFEFHSSKNCKPGGTKYLAWNAAAGILAYNSIINKDKVIL